MSEPPRPGSTRPDRPRIFGIGLNKTGTTSFHDALEALGYRSLHWGGPPIRLEIEASLEQGAPLLSNLDQALDAFSDIEVLATNFAMLDEQYPGSRFMLTVRPLEDWLDSRRRHVENNQRRKARGEYDGNFLVVEEAKWRRRYERHYGAAREYFEGRDDFVEADITAGVGWIPFCELLGIEEPGIPFPHSNKSRR
jgi:Sulfotransferase domain